MKSPPSKPHGNKGKPNAWAQKNEEIAKLKEEIAALRSAKHVKAFVRELGNAVTLLMATTPREQWPNMVETAFRHVAEKMPTAAELWKRSLPKRDI